METVQSNMFGLIINLDEAVKWIEGTREKDVVFGIKFTKKDGSIRTMNAKFGFDDGTLVKNPFNKGLDFAKAGLIGVYDIEAKAYRSFRKESLIAILIDGKWHEVSHVKMTL